MIKTPYTKHLVNKTHIQSDGIIVKKLSSIVKNVISKSCSGEKINLF